MQPDKKPILFETPVEFDEIEIYPIHDLHYGNRQFDEEKWNKLKAEILAQPNRMCLMVGDLLECAIPGSKSDVFYQTVPPETQKEWIANEMSELSDRIIAVVSGNHEHNRATKVCGLYPLYDACCWARIQDRYRENFAVVDVAVGKRNGTRVRQYHYVGFLSHRARESKSWSTVDTLEGFDFMVYGHDHDPKEHARAHLVYDPHQKKVREKSIETVNAGSFLKFGDYAARAAYRPPSDKLYKIILCPCDDIKKRIVTVGFYL